MENFLPDSPVLQALVGTSFTWLMTAVGAAMVFFTSNNISKFGAHIMLGFAAGVMLAASFWSLLAPALALSEPLGNLSWMPAAVGFIAGALFLRTADMLLPHLHYYANVKDGPRSKLKRSTLLVFAVTLHNFPEGLAVGVAFGAAASGPDAARWRQPSTRRNAARGASGGGATLRSGTCEPGGGGRGAASVAAASGPARG